MELQRWTLFGVLDSNFVQNIKMFAVFGNSGDNALILDKNDDVWAMGSNSSGSLGIENSCLLPVKVDELSQKGIKGFAYGAGPHLIAYTESGTCFGWGRNTFCQLGLGYASPTNGPTLISGSLYGKRVIEVACGSHHTLVLTDTGEMFSFGRNSSGQTGCDSTVTVNQPTPTLVPLIENTKIVSIACGRASSFGVTNTGEVYSFGLNETGQLGIGNTENQCNPTKVTLPAFICKVASGSLHTLALSDDGGLYAWGANSWGQLGLGHKSSISLPTRVATDIGRIIDIAASPYSDISAVQTQRKIYMWGKCLGQAITLPLETQLKTLDDVFACYSTPSVCYRPVQRKVGIVEDLYCAFDDPETSDVKFSVEGQIINVHKSILIIRSEFFRNMLQGVENTEAVLTMDGPWRFHVFRAFLKYLYTDEIELNREDTAELLTMAKNYCNTQLPNQYS